MLKTILIGNVGKDAECKEVNGQHVMEFSIAHNERWKDANGVQKEKTIWVNCAQWTAKPSTKLAEFIKKGDKIYVEGDLAVGTYKTQDQRTAVDIRCKISKIQLLGEKPKTEGAPQNGQEQPQPQATTPHPQNASPAQNFNNAADDDDLPF